MKSQIEVIRKHLEDGNSITGIEALNQYQCYRLSSVIQRLRNAGLKITTMMVDQKYARYHLEQQ